MAKSKWDSVKEKLFLVENWAKDGLTESQIAKNLNISEKTFYEYKKKYQQFSQALKKGKEVVDYEVENALYQRAINGDVTAQIFWLKNRKPDKWRDRKETTELELLRKELEIKQKKLELEEKKITDVGDKPIKINIVRAGEDE